jgi:hypothetical protein
MVSHLCVCVCAAVSVEFESSYTVSGTYRVNAMAPRTAAKAAATRLPACATGPTMAPFFLGPLDPFEFELELELVAGALAANVKASRWRVRH